MLATISRHLARAGLVVPEPKKRPKTSYIRFAAQMPNETWQSELIHKLRRDLTAAGLDAGPERDDPDGISMGDPAEAIQMVRPVRRNLRC